MDIHGYYATVSQTRHLRRQERKVKQKRTLVHLVIGIMVFHDSGSALGLPTPLLFCHHHHGSFTFFYLRSRGRIRMPNSHHLVYITISASRTGATSASHSTRVFPCCISISVHARFFHPAPCILSTFYCSIQITNHVTEPFY